MTLGLGRFASSQGMRVNCRSFLAGLMLLSFGCLMLTFFVLMLAVRSAIWSTTIIILVAGLLMLAGLACVYKAESSLADISPAKPRQEGRFTWASCPFDSIGAHPEFRCIFMRKGETAAEWARSAPLSTIRQVEAVPQKTCLCCLEDFLPKSQVAVLPCGHVYHETCIASWSFSTAAAAASCPSCRVRYEGM